MKKTKKAVRAAKRKPARSTPEDMRTSFGRRLHAHADEFIRSEIDDYQSRTMGATVDSVARLRGGVVEKLLPSGDAVPGASNWVLMGPQTIPNGQSLGFTARLLVTGHR